MSRKDMTFRLVQAAPLLAAIGEELSFTKAAERLNVDQSAVSHRVKSLEEALGHTLFVRTSRQLRLTEIGEILCHAAIDTVGAWDAALKKVEHSRSTDSIKLSLSSSLAMKWLIPVLPNAQLNKLNISVDVSEEAVDLHTSEVDAVIRFGRGPYPGLHASHLSHCWMQPVASSTYLHNRPSDESFFTDPATTLLIDRRGEADESEFSWKHYFSATGLTQIDSSPDSNYQFDRADLMLQAAIGGMGVGLGRTLLMEGDVAAGYLKAVGLSIRMQSKYWLLCSPEFAETNRFKRLYRWLKAEIQATTEITSKQ